MKKGVLIINKNLLESYERYDIDENQLKLFELLVEWKTTNCIKLIPKDYSFNSILDIGCTTGIFLKAFSKQLNPSTSIGIDISKEVFELARKEYSEGLYVLGDGECLPFVDNSIDLIIASDVLEHFDDYNLALREMKRVGRYVVFKIPLEKCIKTLDKEYGPDHPSGHYHKWDKRDVLILLKKAGFSIIDYEVEIPPDEIKFYYERYKTFRFSHQYLILIEKLMAKYSKRIYRTIYGSDLFILCKT